MRRKGGRAGLPARVSGRHVVRGRQSSPTLEVRLGEQARLVKTVNIPVRWAAAHPGQDRRLPSVATHSRLQRGDQRPIKGGDRPRRRLQGRYRLGHRPVVPPPHGDGSMYSQANVRAGKWLRPRPRALPSVIVETEKVLREADGSVKRAVPMPAMRDGWKGVRPWVRLESRSGEPVRSPKNTRECLDGLARITSKELAITHFVKGDWHERGPVTDQGHDRPGQPGKKGHNKLEQKSSKRQSDARQLGCVFQDMTPPKSVLRKSTDMRKPIQRVKFTKAFARHTKFRDQNPSLGYICLGEPHQRSPTAPKFEDRPQEKTEWQEEGAREAAWKLAKCVLK